MLRSIFVTYIHDVSGHCNKFHNEELHDAFPQQRVFGWSDQGGRKEEEICHVLRRQKCNENPCLNIWKKNITCNKLGYMKGKYSSGSIISWEGYTAFIRSRKEKETNSSLTVIYIWFREVRRLCYVSKNSLVSYKALFLVMSQLSAEGF